MISFRRRSHAGVVSAVYEQRFRGASDKNFAVVLLGSEGIDCGLILNGEPYGGARSIAGELGHLSIADDPDSAKRCRCMKLECLETYATPRAIDRALRDMGMDFDCATAAQRAAQLPDEHSAAAREVLWSAGAALGRAMVTLLNDPVRAAIPGLPVGHAGPGAGRRVGGLGRGGLLDGDPEGRARR